MSDAKQAPGLSSMPALAMRVHKILIVDDDAGSADVLAGTLKLLGRHTAVETGLRQAIALHLSFNPDVCTLDLELSGRCGHQPADRLRGATLRKLPLIDCAGYAKESPRERSAGDGVAAHLIKPVALVSRLVALARLQAR
jgi:CheY-like chemotaxis protein